VSTPSPAARLHLWVLAPIIGLVPVAVARARSQSEEDREEAGRALRWQLIGASILALHIVLQLGVFGVYHLARSAGPVPPPLESLIGPLLFAISMLNVVSGVAEYGFVAFWAVRAANGADLPFFRGSRR
jgi:hypothetical protein